MPASIWQIVNSFLPLAGLVYLMHLTFPVSFWLTIGIGVLAAGFLIRIFIIQHDCGHGSFFKSKRANNIVGWACSILTLIPYYYWRKQHALHHATNGNLDKRGHGDMTTLTVKEYLALPRWDRLIYRIYRNPFMLILFGPLLLMGFNNRVVRDREHSTKGERMNVHMTNLTTVLFLGVTGWFIGYGELVTIAFPILWVTSAVGIWLFYVQHQFDPTYWKRNPEWSFAEAAVKGSSFLKLPRVFQWFTGNIGFHHIHHLNISIPNYRLEKIYREHPEFHDVFTLTFGKSIRMMFLSLWDEEKGKLLSFRQALKGYDVQGVEEGYQPVFRESAE